MAISHYNYTPSLVAAVVVAALYSVVFTLTLFQWVRYRAWVWAMMVLAAASKSFPQKPREHTMDQYPYPKSNLTSRQWSPRDILCARPQHRMSPTNNSMLLNSL
jgi:hypothetical protein